MTTQGSKTNVSRLHEYLVKKNLIASYDLIKNTGGTQNPEFTFRVTVGSLSEEGSGRSKQEAKHRAAENMLKNFPLIDEENQEVLGYNLECFENNTKENYVGQLKEYCSTQTYPEPVFDLEEEAGPPHNKIFKMTCFVSGLQEFGISKTKKLAKQHAAFKMLEKLKDIKGVTIALNPELPCKKKIPSSIVSDEVIAKYSNLKNNSPSTNIREPAVYYKDYEKAYLKLQNTSPTLLQVMQESNLLTMSNSLNLIKKIAEELCADISISSLTPKDPENDGLTLMTMTLSPPLAAVGKNLNHASYNFLQSLLVLVQE